MDPAEIAKTITNPYERKARLYPALLALLPAFWLVGYYAFSTGEIAKAAASLLVSFGGAYLLTHIAREFGKRAEADLWREWGGAPTTQLQRHADTTIDPITKAARHRFLATKIGRPIATREQEAADAVAADHGYQAGTVWLIEHTRNRQKFPLIFAENVSYGFRRNAFGLRPVAVAIAAVSCGLVLLRESGVTATGFSLSNFLQISEGSMVALLVCGGMLAVWVWFFTKETVRTAAFDYARALLRSCSADLHDIMEAE